jgi:hypothetical protein
VAGFVQGTERAGDATFAAVLPPGSVANLLPG